MTRPKKWTDTRDWWSRFVTGLNRAGTVPHGERPDARGCLTRTVRGRSRQRAHVRHEEPRPVLCVDVRPALQLVLILLRQCLQVRPVHEPDSPEYDHDAPLHHGLQRRFEELVHVQDACRARHEHLRDLILDALHLQGRNRTTLRRADQQRPEKQQ